MSSYQSINPANNQLLKSWPSHDATAVSQALDVADRLFHSSWSKGDIQPRVQVLKKTGRPD